MEAIIHLQQLLLHISHSRHVVSLPCPQLRLEDVLLSCLGILLELLWMKGRDEDIVGYKGVGGREEDSGDR